MADVKVDDTDTTQAVVSNSNIEALKSVQGFDPMEIPISQIYDIFKIIADENDTEAMLFAIKENITTTKYLRRHFYGENIVVHASHEKNFNLIHLMIECGIEFANEFSLNFLTGSDNDCISKAYRYFLKLPHFDIRHFDSVFEFLPSDLVTAIYFQRTEVLKLLLTIPGIDAIAKAAPSDIFSPYYYYFEISKLVLTLPGIDISEN